MDLREETTSQRAAGMQTRKVFALKALLLEERHRERVSDRERDRGARRRCEIVRTRLNRHGRVEDDVGVARHGRSALAGERN